MFTRAPYTTLLLVTLLSLTIGGCANKSRNKTITATQDASQLYERAYRAMNGAQFDVAIQNFKTLEARYPFSTYALQAQLDLAYAYYRFGRPESAISESERFIRFNPTHTHVDYAYYIKGLANFEKSKSLLDRWFPRDTSKLEQTRLQNAFNDFADVVNKFPNSKYAPDARQRMVYLHNKMAEHELYVAEFYVKRKAWVAAANRAKNILTHYSNTKYTEPALTIMVRAYSEMGLEESVEDTIKVLKLNFPNHPELKEKKS